MSDVKHGMPSENDLLDLFTSAFGDGRGNQNYLEWRYYNYPEFNPEKHSFFKKSGSDLVGFRRLYEKEIDLSGSTKPLKGYLTGDSAVHKDYQGEGHFSAIHESILEACHARGVDLLLSYNDKYRVVFDINKHKGFNHIDIPLCLYIISPTKVISQYAERITASADLGEMIPSSIASRIRIHTSDGELSVSEIIGNDDVSQRRSSIHIELVDEATNKIVESVTQDELKILCRKLLHLMASDDVSISLTGGDRINPPDKATFRPTGRQRSYRSTLSDLELDEVLSLYDSQQQEAPAWFRRDAADIRHMMSHPHSNVFLTQHRSKITGFAVLGAIKRGSVTEGRILDIVYQSVEEYEKLFSMIANYAMDNGYDLLVMVSDKKPNNDWIKVDKMALLWDAFTHQDEIEAAFKNDPRISLYDL